MVKILCRRPIQHSVPVFINNGIDKRFQLFILERTNRFFDFRKHHAAIKTRRGNIILNRNIVLGQNLSYSLNTELHGIVKRNKSASDFNKIIVIEHI